jgi:dihydropyrimidine dehydrogenase (NAD+) subunit PreA
VLSCRSAQKPLELIVMADLTATIAGIVSPNPFWLASAPPTNTYGQVARAFDHDWDDAM